VGFTTGSRGEVPGKKENLGQEMMMMMIITPWSRILLEELIVTHLVKKFPGVEPMVKKNNTSTSSAEWVWW
jgi:hypothetical protein